MSDLFDSVATDPKLAAEFVPVALLKGWKDNPRQNDHAVPALVESIKRFGFSAPIVARKEDGMIIAGHTRLKAALQLRMVEVPVRYLDISESDAKLLALADNKLGEIADWDTDVLAIVLRELRDDGVDVDGVGFSEDEINEILATTEDRPDEDDFEIKVDLEAPPVSKLGEVYQLGPHRLICGDSTDPETWQALMQGEKLKCIWTDPPYGIDYVGKTADALTIQNDAMTPQETAQFWDRTFEQLQAVSEPGAAWYACAPPGPMFWHLGQVLETYNWKRSLVWVKDRFALGRGDYHYRHEAIFYGWFEGAARLHPVPRDVDTVQECKRPSASKEHPTMKPVKLITGMIENSSKPGWLVGEPFGGSGSTLIACAMTGRIARVVELDPVYCDVIRKRWTRYAKQAGIDPGPGGLDGETE